MVYFASSPVLAVRWFAKNCDPPRKFESWYGITRGLSAPNQAPEIWERWFEPGQKYAGPGSLDVNKSNELRATIAHLEEVFEAPFVNKWQGHAVHIRPLVEALPNLLFIRVKRDPLQVAQSILKGRMELRGTQNSWTSVRPSGYQRIADKSPIEQVCGQIYYVERDMDRDSEETGIDRFFEVDYRRICTEPKAVLRDIREFYERRSGYSLRERYMVPDSFPYSDSQKVGESDMRALDSCLRRLQSVGAE